MMNLRNHNHPLCTMASTEMMVSVKAITCNNNKNNNSNIFIN